MGRITVKNVLEATKTGEVFNLVNAIRNSSSSFYKEFVPLASAENVAEVGRAITLHTQTQNEFINALVNRIGLVIVRHVTLSNPLSRFKTGTMEMGNTIEEIFTDLTRSHLYDPYRSEVEVFKREIPNVKTLYHELNRKEFYKQTIQEDTLKQAFTSWDKFGSFTTSIIQALYNSAEVDEYLYMKMLIAKYYSEGHFTTVALPVNYEPKDLVKSARAMATRLTMPQGSRLYNSLAVHTRSNPEDLYILMSPELAAEIDVDVLASAFNMDKATFIGNRIIVDDLGGNPDGSQKIQMVLIDKSFFMVKDNELKMTSQYNPEGLYWNYWLHVWQTLSTSRFANAVAFVTNVKDPVAEVVVNPSIREQRRAMAYTYSGIDRLNDTIDGYKVTNPVRTWRVVNANDPTTAVTGVTLTPAADGKTCVVQTNGPGGYPDQFILIYKLEYEDGISMDGSDPLKYVKEARSLITAL